MATILHRIQGEVSSPVFHLRATVSLKSQFWLFFFPPCCPLFSPPPFYASSDRVLNQLILSPREFFFELWGKRFIIDFFLDHLPFLTPDMPVFCFQLSPILSFFPTLLPRYSSPRPLFSLSSLSPPPPACLSTFIASHRIPLPATPSFLLSFGSSSSPSSFRPFSFCLPCSVILHFQPSSPPTSIHPPAHLSSLSPFHPQPIPSLIRPLRSLSSYSQSSSLPLFQPPISFRLLPFASPNSVSLPPPPLPPFF